MLQKIDSPLARLRRTLFLIVVSLIPICSSASTAPPVNLDTLLSKYGITRQSVSIDIRHVDSQTPVLTLNKDIARNPASVMKLLTTLASLEVLGPAHQWKTEYLTDGNIVDGVLKGNLFMKGSGDPFLTLERFWYHLFSLRQNGITHIEGDFVIDNTAFELKPHDPDAFDGKATRLYNVGPSASLVNFSATNFVIQPKGNKVRVHANPPLANLVIENKLKLVSGKCGNKQSGWSFETRRKEGKIIARFNGKYRSKCGEYSLGRSITSNETYAFELFKSLWKSSGGGFNGTLKVGKTPETANIVTSHFSESLGNIIGGINKFSNNVMAKQLLISLGMHLYDQPGTVETGVLAIRSWLNAIGMAMPNLQIDNGSGLSRKSRITAEETIPTTEPRVEQQLPPGVSVISFSRRS